VPKVPTQVKEKRQMQEQKPQQKQQRVQQHVPPVPAPTKQQPWELDTAPVAFQAAAVLTPGRAAPPAAAAGN
jgi:hypothetical protein